MEDREGVIVEREREKKKESRTASIETCPKDNSCWLPSSSQSEDVVVFVDVCCYLSLSLFFVLFMVHSKEAEGE